MRIFAEENLSEFLERQQQAMLDEIEREPSNSLLNANESDYVKYLAEKYYIQPITFGFDAVRVSSAERLIPAEKHPPDFHFRFRQSYSRQVITFHLPFTGEPELLNCQPSTRILWTENVAVVGSEIQFGVVNWRNDSEALGREKQGILGSIAQQNANVTNDVTQFNSRLEELARQAVSGRKSRLLTQLNVVASLGIPLRRAPEVPQTFAVPIIAKRLVVKPSAPASTFSPDPTLDDQTYQDILSIIHDMGVAMERLPSSYLGKHEEDLRDFLLMMLCTHYPNTTGETFNKSGKTDILVRHEGSNIFVGECKFWNGLAGFHRTIDQILGYLTWRDSKAAIVCFVPNKEFGPVLREITSGAPQHPCFIRLESKKQESWVQYEFRLASDPTRNVHLAVLTFHFPAE
jgi:hypothetical protein